MKLEIAVVRQEGAIIASLHGSINAANADEVLQELLQLVTPNCKLVLDAAGLEYISSAGLRLLLHLHRAAATAGSQLILARLVPDVEEVMQVTGFLRHFVHFPTLEFQLNPP